MYEAQFCAEYFKKDKGSSANFFLQNLNFEKLCLKFCALIDAKI